MSEKSDYIWQNNQILYNSTKIKTTGHWSGTNETIRIYKGQLFQLDKYIERLYKSISTLMIEIPFPPETIKSACKDLVTLNHVINGLIKISVFLHKDHSVEIVISSSTLDDYDLELQSQKKLKINISSLTKEFSTNSKHHIGINPGFNLLNHLAKKQALASGYKDSLIMDYRHYIIESTEANFFMVKNKIIYTPTTEYCFNGITRQIIINLAKKKNIEIRETNISKSDIYTADEAFLTNTLSAITPIESIENIVYNANPITQLLQSYFFSLIQS